MTFIGRFKSWTTRDGYAGEVERRDRNPWNIGKLLPKGHGRDDDEPEEAGGPGGIHTHVHLPQSMGRANVHGSDDDEALSDRLDELEEQIQGLAEALSRVITILENAGGGRSEEEDDDDDEMQEQHPTTDAADLRWDRDARALVRLNGIHARRYGLPSEYRDVLTLNREELAARANETKNIRGAHDLHTATARLADLQRLHDLTWPAGRVF